MKLRTADNKETTVLVCYNSNRMDSYTLILENGDIWACGIVDQAPSGFAGNCIEKGYTSVKEYQADMALRTSYIGYQVKEKERIPDTIIDYVHQIINSGI